MVCSYFSKSTTMTYQHSNVFTVSHKRNHNQNKRRIPFKSWNRVTFVCEYFQFKQNGRFRSMQSEIVTKSCINLVENGDEKIENRQEFQNKVENEKLYTLYEKISNNPKTGVDSQENIMLLAGNVIYFIYISCE